MSERVSEQEIKRLKNAKSAKLQMRFISKDGVHWEMVKFNLEALS